MTKETPRPKVKVITRSHFEMLVTRQDLINLLNESAIAAHAPMIEASAHVSIRVDNENPDVSLTDRPIRITWDIVDG